MPKDRHAAQFTFKLKIEDFNEGDCEKKGKLKNISLVEVDVVPLTDGDADEMAHDPLDVKPGECCKTEKCCEIEKCCKTKNCHFHRP